MVKYRDKTRISEITRKIGSIRPTTPQAGKHGREKAMVFPQQYRKNKGRKGVGDHQRNQLKIDVPAAACARMIFMAAS
jgi:hypothetical protein